MTHVFLGWGRKSSYMWGFGLGDKGYGIKLCKLTVILRLVPRCVIYKVLPYYNLFEPIFLFSREVDFITPTLLVRKLRLSVMGDLPCFPQWAGAMNSGVLNLGPLSYPSWIGPDPRVGRC